MTENRFECYDLIFLDGFIKDRLTNENIVEPIKLIFLLNELHKENIRLKRDFDSCSHNWALMYDEAKEKVEALTKENWELEQENEKLENRLMELSKC